MASSLSHQVWYAKPLMTPRKLCGMLDGQVVSKLVAQWGPVQQSIVISSPGHQSAKVILLGATRILKSACVYFILGSSFPRFPSCFSPVCVRHLPARAVRV